MTTSEASGGYMPTSAGRTISPRRGLPSGRAVVGALLVTVAAVGAFAAAGRGDSGPSESYLVMARRVDAGAPLSAGDLRLESMQIPSAAAANALQSGAAVEGATAKHNLEPGDLLSVHDLLPAPTAGSEPVGAIHEVALPVSRQRISARAAPGDRVTVLATVRSGNEPLTVLAVEDALVLGWAGDESLSGTGVLTLAIDEAPDAAALAHLSVHGEVTAVVTTRALDDSYPAYFLDPAPEPAIEPAGGQAGEQAGDQWGAGLPTAPQQQPEGGQPAPGQTGALP